MTHNGYECAVASRYHTLTSRLCRWCALLYLAPVIRTDAVGSELLLADDPRVQRAPSIPAIKKGALTARKSESFLESKLSYRSPSSSHCTQHARTDSNRYAAHHLACCQRRPATLAPHARSRRHTQLRLCAVGRRVHRPARQRPAVDATHVQERVGLSHHSTHTPSPHAPHLWLTR